MLCTRVEGEEKEEGNVFTKTLNFVYFITTATFVSSLSGLTRRQYSGIMALLDSFDRLKLSSKYRKYRPLVNKVSGNASKW